MKDEIKELLEEMKYFKEHYKDFKNVEVNLQYDGEKITKIYDYITNLQKVNKRYKKMFKGKEVFYQIMPNDIDFIILSKADYNRQQEDSE